MRRYKTLFSVISCILIFVQTSSGQTPVWDDALGDPADGSFQVSSTAGELRIAQTVPYSPDTDWSIVADNMDMAFRGNGQTWIRVVGIEETGAGSVDIVVVYAANTTAYSRNAFLGTEQTHIEILQEACSGTVTPPAPDPGKDDDVDEYPDFGLSPDSPPVPDMPKPSAGLSLQKDKNWRLSETVSGSYGHKEVMYYDGLGVPQQEVMVGCGACPDDIVSIYAYDIFGNRTRSYLPYAKTGVSDGAFIPSGLSAQQPFYAALYGEEDSRLAFDEKLYDPISGGNLRCSSMSGKTLKGHPSIAELVVNQSNEVEILDVDAESGSATVSGRYQSGVLLGEHVTDGDGRETVVWKDKNGRTVCSDIGTGTDKCRTLYGYDFRGKLSWVMSPEGYANRPADGTPLSINCEFAEKSCWRYRYDSRGNMTARYSPGGGLRLMLHDPAGRLALMQDSNMRNNGTWLSYSYDGIGRLIAVKTVKDDTGKDWEMTLPELDIETLSGMVRVINSLDECDYDVRPDGMPEDMMFTAVPDMMEKQDLNSDLRGRLVHEKISTTKGNPYVERAYYYDRHGNVAQTVEKRPEGILRTTCRYDLQKHLTGMLVEYDEQENVHDDYTREFEYDGAGRLVHETANLNGHVAEVEYIYDCLGRLTGRRHMGSDCLDNYPREQFIYNMQGWEVGRKVSICGDDDIFTSNLDYYEPAGGIEPSFTGNISSWMWKDSSDKERFYVFSYDMCGRLTDAAEYEDGLLEDKYTEKEIAYDRNGNILSMKRANGGTLEVLAFTYDGNRRSGDDFSYDPNGNLTYDGVSEVLAEYDAMNLPSVLYGDGDYYVEYSHLSDGTKVESVMEETEHGYYYAGPFVYRRSASGHELLGVQYGGGRIKRRPDGSYGTELYFKDHLGSTRLKVTGNGEITGEYSYLPYGELFSDSSAVTENDWLYGGKEQERGNDVRWYDSGARWQTTHGIFTSHDPLAEKYFPISPYAYCAGNPVNMVDPYGMDEWDVNKSGKIISCRTRDDKDIVNIVDDMNNENYNGSSEEKSYSGRIEFKYGTLKNEHGDFIVSNMRSGIELFSFLAKETFVEFGMIEMLKGDVVIHTNHNKSSVLIVPLAIKLSEKGNTIMAIFHSHPHNTIPSGFKDGDVIGDKISASMFDISNGYKVEYYVYQPKYDRLIQYDSNGIIPGAIYWNTLVL